MKSNRNVASTPEERKELCDQIVSIFEMNGIVITQQTLAYMQPLLGGSMTADEHEALLESLIQENEHG